MYAEKKYYAGQDNHWYVADLTKLGVASLAIQATAMTPAPIATHFKTVSAWVMMLLNLLPVEGAHSLFSAAFLVFASPDAMLGAALLATFFTFLF